MAYTGLSTVMCIIGFQCPWIIIQFGWFVSWIYLRFYKKNTGDVTGGIVTYGDRSETFSLLSWFPPLVQYVHPTLLPSSLSSFCYSERSKPLGLLGNTVYSLANKLHLIPTTHGDVETGIYTQVPGSARAEAERRRYAFPQLLSLGTYNYIRSAMALKALDQRLANTASASLSPSPQTPGSRPPPVATRTESSGSAVSHTSGNDKTPSEVDSVDLGKV